MEKIEVEIEDIYPCIHRIRSDPPTKQHSVYIYRHGAGGVVRVVLLAPNNLTLHQSFSLGVRYGREYRDIRNFLRKLYHYPITTNARIS